MNFLLIGGNGFIGSHLVDKLIVEGHSVSVFDKYREYYREPIKGVKYFYGEFGNRGEIRNALSGIDIVCHLLSTTHPKTSNDDPIYDITTNLIETVNLLDECRRNNIAKIIFISSGGTVYGIPQELPIRENSNTNPICSYGITKLAIEKYIMLFKHLYGIDYVIIRPSNPYGERQKPYGAQGLISVFLGKIYRNEPIEVWGDGEVVRDFIYIQDLVDGIYKASIINNTENIYNLGSGYGFSINEILKILERITNKKLAIKYYPPRVFDIPKIFLDIEKARLNLKWQPQIPIEIGVAKTWEFINSL